MARALFIGVSEWHIPPEEMVCSFTESLLTLMLRQRAVMMKTIGGMEQKPKKKEKPASLDSFRIVHGV